MATRTVLVEGIVCRLIGLVLLLLAAPADAAELSSSAQTEIDALLNRLGASKCQFYRNGSWHSGSEARDHLQMKFDYLVEKGLITDSEETLTMHFDTHEVVVRGSALRRIENALQRRELSSVAAISEELSGRARDGQPVISSVEVALPTKSESSRRPSQ